MTEEQARKALAEADSLSDSGRFTEAIAQYKQALSVFREDTQGN